jgi:hypothetical protein
MITAPTTTTTTERFSFDSFDSSGLLAVCLYCITQGTKCRLRAPVIVKLFRRPYIAQRRLIGFTGFTLYPTFPSILKARTA